MPTAYEVSLAGDKADSLIATEVAIQDKMWGVDNHRADATEAQMQSAAMASIGVVVLKGKNVPAELAVKMCREDFYPSSWDKTAFRDYGSDIANLVVAAAFLRSEIKRLLLTGADTTRTKRGEAYTTATPNVSSEEAARELQS
jgi:hypothetical protein